MTGARWQHGVDDTLHRDRAKVACITRNSQQGGRIGRRRKLEIRERKEETDRGKCRREQSKEMEKCRIEIAKRCRINIHIAMIVHFAASTAKSVKQRCPSVRPSVYPSRFYRAMLCIRGTSHWPVSVRLSQVGVLLKRLNVGSHKQHHTISHGL